MRSALIIIILLPLIIYSVDNFYFAEFKKVENKVDYVVSTSAQDVVRQVFKDISYSNVIKIESKVSGEISSIEINNEKMNPLLERCNTLMKLQIDNEIQSFANEELLLKSGLISLNINTPNSITLDQIDSKVMTDFEVIDDKKTNHIIYIYVNARLLVTAGSSSRTINSVIKVPILEAIILRNIS